MKAPLSWLKEFVDIHVDISTLCEKLVGIGLEVEACEYLGKDIENVVTGKIEKIEKHPDADKLVICRVNVRTEVLQIVTGATNVKEGDIVPVAKHHSKLPGNKVITKGKLRGVESFGMLCSGKELGINDDVYPGAEVDGILILNEDTPIGQNILETLGLDDYILDIGVTSNRPDCNSILGLAREAAVALGTTCKEPELSFHELTTENVNDYVTVDVKNPELCPNYMAKAIKDVKIASSPVWMRRRLWKMGLNSICNMVDITNYVLLEMGQPMHAFDHKDILNRHIIVRRADDGEKIIPFDNKEYTLDRDILVIADEKRAVGLAGIMGGQNSGIHDETNTVVFEAAKFLRENIRRSSKKLGLRSDSSARFEKGVDSYTTERALDRACHLVEQLHCGSIVRGTVDVSAQPHYQKTIVFPFDRVKKLLGVEIPEKIALEILKNLNITASLKNGELSCEVPSYREDLERECDIIEELIRIYGYDNIHPTLLENSSLTNGGKSDVLRAAEEMKEVLNGAGYSETITYSFAGSAMNEKLLLTEDSELRQQIRIKNPLGEEMSLMRRTLAGSMLNVFHLNLSRDAEHLKFFEYGKVYRPKALPLTELPTETNMVCLACCGKQESFLTLKTATETLLKAFGIDANYLPKEKEFLHPGISAEIVYESRVLGWIGQVHPTVQNQFEIPQKVWIAELNFDEIRSLRKGFSAYRPITKFPSITRDISVMCDEKTLVGDLMNGLKRSSKLLEDITLFDIYRGDRIEKGKKSVSFTLTYRVADRTLKDDEVDTQVSQALEILKNDYNAVLR